MKERSEGTQQSRRPQRRLFQKENHLSVSVTQAQLFSL